MELDILELLDTNEADLSIYEMTFVRQAQEKKDKLTKKLIEDKKSLHEKLLRNGVLRGTIYTKGIAALDEEYQAEVQRLADDLAFRLEYLRIDSPSSPIAYSYPNNPDYSLDPANRYYVVYNYYMAMSDPSVRFAIFQADQIAPDYLGTFYATLYDRLRSYIKIT